MRHRRILEFIGTTAAASVTILLLAVTVLAASLATVTDTLSSNVAGATATHVITITTASVLPGNGKIEIDFPAGFNLSTVSFGSVTGPNGLFPLSINGQAVFVARDGSGSAYSPGTVTVVLK